MQQSALDGMQDKFKVVYGTAGQPCPRCGTLSNIRARGQGDDNRTTYWCPRCQR
jgi:endonuclease-8